MAVTLLALVVRLFTATWTGLATDEANGVMIAVTGSWSEMIQWLKEDGNPPLLSVILRLYDSVFGHSDLAMKILAVILATLQIPLSYLICRQFLDRPTSLQVAIILALCPQLVRYSTMLRSYSLISILGLLSTWCCMKTMRTKRGWFWPITYGVTTVLLVYSHYWGGFVALGQACLAGIGYLRRWFTGDNLRQWFVGALISVALFAPWVPILLYQLKHDLSPWDTPALPSTLLVQFASSVLVGAYFSLDPFDQFCLVLSNALLFLIVFSPRTLLTERFNGTHWKVVAVCGYIAGLMTTLFIPAVRRRYLTPFAPLLAIVYVTGFQRLFPRLPRALAYVLPILFMFPMWAPRLQDLASEPETSTPKVVEEINNSADRSKDLVVVSWPIIAPAINFYVPEDIRLLAYPDLDRRRFTRWDGMIGRLKDDKNLSELIQEMDKTLDRGGKVWLIDSFHTVQMRDYNNSDAVKRLPYLEAEQFRMDQIRTWLSLHANQLGPNRAAPGRDWSIFLSVFQARPNSPANL